MDRFVANGSGRLHVREELKPLAPHILMIPGMFGTVEHCESEFRHLSEYSMAAMSLRGRGQSSFDYDDYSFPAHVSDAVKVIDSTSAEKMTLFAHSFGCLVAIAAAAERPKRVSGLILVDKGPKLLEIKPKWLERIKSNPPPASSIAVAKKIYEQFTSVELLQTLIDLNIPTLVFKGEGEGHALAEFEAQELSKLPFVKLVRLSRSGHWPSENDYPIFITEIKKFIESSGSFGLPKAPIV